ncbi:hypothetical protein THAOC_09033, partial [Thalassiosira oceanica]
PPAGGGAPSGRPSAPAADFAGPGASSLLPGAADAACFLRPLFGPLCLFLGATASPVLLDLAAPKKELVAAYSSEAAPWPSTNGTMDGQTPGSELCALDPIVSVPATRRFRPGRPSAGRTISLSAFLGSGGPMYLQAGEGCKAKRLCGKEEVYGKKRLARLTVKWENAFPSQIDKHICGVKQGQDLPERSICITNKDVFPGMTLARSAPLRHTGVSVGREGGKWWVGLAKPDLICKVLKVY